MRYVPVRSTPPISTRAVVISWDLTSSFYTTMRLCATRLRTADSRVINEAFHS
jgi:hypothetical protein